MDYCLAIFLLVFVGAVSRIRGLNEICTSLPTANFQGVFLLDGTLLISFNDQIYAVSAKQISADQINVNSIKLQVSLKSVIPNGTKLLQLALLLDEETIHLVLDGSSDDDMRANLRDPETGSKTAKVLGPFGLIREDVKRGGKAIQVRPFKWPEEKPVVWSWNEKRIPLPGQETLTGPYLIVTQDDSKPKSISTQSVDASSSVPLTTAPPLISTLPTFGFIYSDTIHLWDIGTRQVFLISYSALNSNQSQVRLSIKTVAFKRYFNCDRLPGNREFPESSSAVYVIFAVILVAVGAALTGFVYRRQRRKKKKMAVKKALKLPKSSKMLKTSPKTKTPLRQLRSKSDFDFNVTNSDSGPKSGQMSIIKSKTNSKSSESCSVPPRMTSIEAFCEGFKG